MREWSRIEALCTVASCVALLLGCVRGAPPEPPWPAAGSRELGDLERVLDAERATRSQSPWKGVVRVTMRDPRSSRVIDGRGGIAVSAGRAIRVILLGAAGLTMFDAWVTPERWRVAVPPAGVVRRGEADDPNDLPVAFLRWWFFTPLGGTLLAARAVPGGSQWLLKDHGAVIDLSSGACPGGRLLRAVRRAGGHAETVEECRSDAAPRPGDSVRYADLSSGLKVDLTVESVDDVAPESEAFIDPDRGGT